MNSKYFMNVFNDWQHSPLTGRDLWLSYAYWSLWIFVLFLGPEVLAYLRLIPLGTLSRTAWSAEHYYPWLKTILFGFLIGLAVHIRFETRLGFAELGGLGIALIMHKLWNV